MGVEKITLCQQFPDLDLPEVKECGKIRKRLKGIRLSKSLHYQVKAVKLGSCFVLL